MTSDRPPDGGPRFSVAGPIPHPEPQRQGSSAGHVHRMPMNRRVIMSFGVALASMLILFLSFYSEYRTDQALVQQRREIAEENRVQTKVEIRELQLSLCAILESFEAPGADPLQLERLEAAQRRLECVSR